MYLGDLIYQFIMFAILISIIIAIVVIIKGFFFSSKRLKRIEDSLEEIYMDRKK
ncbi:hypothetical protein [Peribacillus tepidiphilus]|jgi:uncharacterized protein YneF (UPF0154 family)|uniref:hypothetical protein n=1 Tax=Peribacillus tepidiphilus TaxID=2652445 RepID=UPI0035B5362E